MKPAELYQELRLCCTKPPGIALRDALGVLLRGEKRVSLRYEWVKDWAAFNKILFEEGVELSDGTEWITLWLTT